MHRNGRKAPGRLLFPKASSYYLNLQQNGIIGWCVYINKAPMYLCKFSALRCIILYPHRNLNL